MNIFFWKNQKPYPRSFAKRLTWRIMLRLLIFMGIPTIMVFLLGYGLVFVGASEVCDRLIKGECEEIRRITSDVYVASINTAPVIEDNLDHPEKMVGIMERMIKTNERLRSCGISFIEGYYPQKGHWFCPYAVRRDSTTIETKILGGKSLDYLNAKWFKEALSKDEGYWGKAFFDGTDQQTALVSYLLPIHDKQHRVVAILGVDMSLDWLNEKVQLTKVRSRHNNSITIDYSGDNEWKADYNAYYFMVDTTGTLLLHPDKNRILKKQIQNYVTTDPKHIIQEILSLQSGTHDDLLLDGSDVFITYKPVKYTSWSIALAVPMLYLKGFAYTISGFLILIILFGMLAVYIFGRRTIKKAVKPLKQLAASADEVAKGNFDTPLPNIQTGDEIHQLRDSFENMQHSLTRYVNELRNTTAQKASMESELKIAHDIQMNMLPKTFPPYPERNDIDIYGSLTPAKAVGGDLFDFFIRANQLFFCIGDVAGKGIPASLFMAVTRSLFRNISAHVVFPERIAYTLNNALCENNETNMFVTLFTGVLDLATGHLRYCNAGHNAPLLVGCGVTELPCLPNLPLGILSEFQFEAQDVDLDSDTTIFLFTDGLNEAENALHEQFGDERIQQVANRLLAKHEHQPINITYEMYQAVHDFVNGAEQSDDLTMLAIQYTNKQ